MRSLTLEVWLSSTLRPTKAANCSHDHLHVYAYDVRIIRHVEIGDGVARVACTKGYSCHVPESVTGVRVSAGVRCNLLKHRSSSVRPRRHSSAQPANLYSVRGTSIGTESTLLYAPNNNNLSTELSMVVPPPPAHPWTVHVGVVVQVCHTVAAEVELLGLDLSGNGDRVRVVGANCFPHDKGIFTGGAHRWSCRPTRARHAFPPLSDDECVSSVWMHGDVV